MDHVTPLKYLKDEKAIQLETIRGLGFILKIAGEENKEQE